MLKRKMTVIVKGVLVTGYENELLKAIIRRNCKIETEAIASKIYWLGSRGFIPQARSDFGLEFERFDITGIVRDFELLKMVGAIEEVEIQNTKKYIVQ